LFTDFANGNTDVFVINPDGSGRRQLTIDGSKDSTPSWSPDGALIVFVANRGGDLQRTSLWLMRADGTYQREIYRGEGSSLEPFWSSATDQIFFSNDEIGGRTGNFEVFAISPDGQQKRRVTESPRFDVSPSVSPDGKRVAFVSNFDGNSEVYVSNTDGTGRLRITRDKAEDTSPSWSADGLQLFFTSDRTGKRAIYRASLN
jgi:TolB protein